LVDYLRGDRAGAANDARAEVLSMLIRRIKSLGIKDSETK